MKNIFIKNIIKLLNKRNLFKLNKYNYFINQLILEIMEAIKSRKTNIIVLLLSFGFLFLASCAFGQVSRITLDGEKTVKRYTDAISIKNPLIGDDITLSAYSDSVDAETITFAIYVYFPENINGLNKQMVISYLDGSMDILQQEIYDKNDGYAEYKMIDNINNISSKKIESILIRNVAKYKVSDKSYFINFFAAL